MADTLLLHYDPAHTDTATWSLVNGQGELTSMITTATLDEAAAVAANHRCIVLLDSSWIHLNRVQLPVSNRQKMLRAVPFALEDQIADEVEDFHFVLGKSDPAAGTPVAGMRRDQLEQILARFADAGIQPDAIIPDVLCLAADAEQWCVLQHRDRMLIEYDAASGTVIDAVNLPLLLQAGMAREDTPPPRRILLFHPDGEPQAIAAAQLQESLGGNGSPDEAAAAPEIVEVSYNTHPLVVFCVHYLDALPLNLLQGSYKPRRKSAGKWRRWRLAAALALVWLVLYLGASVFELTALKHKNERLHVMIDQLYKKTFPGSSRIVNARVQMEQKLEELRGAGSSDGGGFLSLLAGSVDAIGRVEDISLRTLNFRNNRIEIELTGKGLQSIENLNRFLNENPRLKAEIASSTAEKTGVKGNIRVQVRTGGAGA